MLKPPTNLRAFCFMQAVDLRCRFDRLAARVQDKLCAASWRAACLYFSVVIQRKRCCGGIEMGMRYFTRGSWRGFLKGNPLMAAKRSPGMDLEELLCGVDLSRI